MIVSVIAYQMGVIVLVPSPSSRDNAPGNIFVDGIAGRVESGKSGSG
jgi:hypothetical protein